MARITESELERLKAEVSLVKLVERSGVELKRHGAKDLVGLCPFHDDTHPSLVITPELNLWHCLGACRAGGSVIDWVMRHERVSFTHAVEMLREDFPSLAAEVRSAYVKAESKPEFVRSAEDQVVLNQIMEYYHSTLKQSPEALKYLQKRGITDPAAIGYFKLGFANRTLGYRLPTTKVKGGPGLRGQLQRLGIMRASGHEHFSGSLTIPIRDEQDNMVQCYGRKITENLRAGTPLHLYMPGDHKGVFNLPAIQHHPEIILCEALIDALTFWCAGFRNVTSSYGINGFTEAHLAAFKQYGVKRVLIAYDRDDAGNQAAEAVAEILAAAGIECFRILFPKGMDANSYALKVQPAAKSLALAVRKAEWMGKGVAPAVTSTSLAVTDDVIQAPETEAAVVAATESAEPASAGTSEPVPSLAAGLDELETLIEQRVVPMVQPAAEPPPALDAPASAPASASYIESALPPPAPVEPERMAAAAASVPPASPVTVPAPRPELPAEVSEQEVVISLGDRRYRVRGLAKNLSYELLKVNVLVSRGEAFHVDTFDLYSAKHRSGYIKQAAVELAVKEDVVKHDLGRVLLKLEALQDELIKQTLTPKDTRPALSEEDHRAALALLREPDLAARIVADFARCGIVGEATSLLTSYMACVSRKLDRPLAVLIQSTSAAGKSALMDAVLAMMPEDERVSYSAMTGQSLFYLGETDLKHKILALAEEEGASQASYALKLLQSEGVLTIASTGKDPDSGKLVTQEYRVEGPVMLFLTTTAIHIDEELLNRCLVLTVNETREQTRAIHALQRTRHTLQGLLADEDKKDLLAVHRNAQRLLRPLLVANPYAERLTFLDAKTRTRRDHVKYLMLIRAIALLHQYQRDVKVIEHKGEKLDYIEVTLSDIALANRLANDVLGRTLDELPPQTRRLLTLVHELVKERTGSLDMKQADYRFSRRDVREATGWSDTQLRVHLGRLTDLEYLLVHRGGRGASFVYELTYHGEGEDGDRFLPGLIDVEKLTQAGTTTATSRGETPQFAGSTRGQNGGIAGGAPSAKTPASADSARAPGSPPENLPENASTAQKNLPASSYRSDDTLPLFATGE